MSRRSRGSRERAERQVLPLKLALYHEIHDMPGGVPVFCLTYGGISETTIYNCLNPNHHDRAPTLRQFEQIFEYCRHAGRGQRIIDSLALSGNFLWMEKPVGTAGDGVLRGVDQLVRKVGAMVSSVTDAVSDGQVDPDELAELEKGLMQLFQAGFSLIESAKAVK